MTKKWKSPHQLTAATILAGVLASSLVALSVPAPAAASAHEVADSGAESLNELVELGHAASVKLDSLVEDSAPTIDGVALSDAAIVNLPSVDDESVTFASLESDAVLSIELPGTEMADGDDGVLGDDDGNSFLVHGTEMGGVQILGVATSPSASFEFEVDFELPGDSHWVATESGSLELREASGESLAAIDVPWAIDSTGATLPTHKICRRGVQGAGRTVEKVVALVKKYVKSKTSLSKAQINALATT